MIAAAGSSQNLVARRIILKAAQRALAPKGRKRVSEWAAENRVLAEDSSPEPGRWKNERTPFLVEIMDQLSEDSPARKVVFMKPTQNGGTEVGSNWIGYIMDHAGGPAAVVMPTDKSMADWRLQKFDPMARATPAVRDALIGRSNRSSNDSAERKRFKGGILYFKTAGSTADLKSTSLRYAVADEVDEWAWTTTQGDPLGLLEARQSAFHDHKLYVVSSPTLKDASRIEEAFLGGDQRQYFVPCPECGERQVLRWPNLRWKRLPSDAEAPHVDHAWYVCEECGSEIEEGAKPGMLAAGRWVAKAPHAPYPSYHLNALYSPLGLGRSWAELATEWIRAQGDKARLMRFVNTRLAETWADTTSEITAGSLAARAEPWTLGTICPGCILLTAGVDTQDDRLEIQVLGHGRGDRTWTVDYHVIYGSPANETTWQALEAYLQRTYPTRSGRELAIEATAIDSGGHFTHDVYRFVRSARLKRCMATKGHSSPGRAILGKPARQDANRRGAIDRRGVALYMLGADTGKHLLYARIADDAGRAPQDRKLRFPSDLDRTYFEGLVAETYNPLRHRWELKRGKRNEPLDTWVLALAAAHHPEIYLHKWKPSDWTRREGLFSPEDLDEFAPAPPAKPAAPPGQESADKAPGFAAAPANGASAPFGLRRLGKIGSARWG